MPPSAQPYSTGVRRSAMKGCSMVLMLSARALPETMHSISSVVRRASSDATLWASFRLCRAFLPPWHHGPPVSYICAHRMIAFSML